MTIARADGPGVGAREPPPVPRIARLRYVDALRAYAVGLVFVIHVCEVFNPWDEWHITNAERSRVLGELVVLMAPWIMPLVMLLAGVSAWYALPMRNNAAYVRERAQRVFLPLVGGTILLVPVQVWLERRLHGEFAGSLLEFYPQFFDGIYPAGNFSWHHLWFLAHLFAYSLLALPVFRYLQRPEGRRLLELFGRIGSEPGGVMWLALPLILERSLLWGLLPEHHMLTSDWSNHALLFVAYVYGFVLAGSPTIRTAIDAQWRRAGAVAVLSTATLMVGTWRDVVPARMPPPYTLSYLAFWTLYGWCAWAWMVSALGFARRYLDRADRVSRTAAPHAYAWYVLHQPIVVAIAFVVVQWKAPLPAKATVLFVTSGVATILAARLLRRLTGGNRALGEPTTRDRSVSVIPASPR